MSSFLSRTSVRDKDRFRQASGFEERKAEQDGIPCTAPDCALDVSGCGDGFDQHGVDSYTDHDQKALKPERKQGFQIVFSHFAPFAVGKCGKRDRADGRKQVNFQHPPVNDEENTDGHDLDGESDQQGLNPQAKQGGDIHGVEFRLEVARDGRQVDFRAPADDTRASVDNMLCQIEDACNNVKSMRNEENRYDRLEYPSKEYPGVQIVKVIPVNDHGNQFVTDHKSQDHSGNRDDDVL